MPKRGTSFIARVIAGIALIAAFLVMSSIFVPVPKRADAQSGSNAAGGPARGASPRPSADAHEGLRSLGSIESGGYALFIFASDLGPRFTVHDLASGEELGTLLSAEQVERAFPDLRLPAIDFSGGSGAGLMLAEPQWP